MISLTYSMTINLCVFVSLWFFHSLASRTVLRIHLPTKPKRALFFFTKTTVQNFAENCTREV
ncbi:MAG: hypothetical protein DWQ58_06730 [Microcystis aeruginosa TA09]|nr:MAG: hypothetical protein DWQ58_06730 [Microcystis aeruginosa TA09]